ncbi:uncharacterized protein [Amphiura filiformis]|uniref:uncharacterized protein n=1 Tax=Amphiura filiformis TaxID=82378 RepID=UPI003B223752
MAGKFDILPEGYRHTFLIRNPARVFRSYYSLLVDKIGLPSLKSFLPECYAYKEMCDLHDYVTKELKQNSVIVDAGDLKADPEGIMRSYCNSTGIPFQESMLSWKPELPNPPDWKAPFLCWMGNKQVGMYNAAFGSSGFKQSVDGDALPINVEELSGEVKECTEYSMPYYEKLYALRLKPE